jgi:hypothetical protein
MDKNSAKAAFKRADDAFHTHMQRCLMGLERRDIRKTQRLLNACFRAYCATVGDVELAKELWNAAVDKALSSHPWKGSDAPEQ